MEYLNKRQRGHVHQFLRRTTAAAHHALDHHRLMQRLTSGDLTGEQYAESLAAMCKPHARLEGLVHGSRHHSESGLDLSPRLELLESDLLEMGRPVPPVPQTASDLLDGCAAWWGRVYVLEGSRRGSAVIARCVHASLGDSVPIRFFGASAVPGDDDSLLATLERELENPEDLEQAVASARAAFAAFAAGLDAFNSGECDAGNAPS